MADNFLNPLLDQAAKFVILQESGNRPQFPQIVVEKLLSSQDGDSWHGGLYLVSRLSREIIAERFFGQSSNYHALATFLSAGCAAYAESHAVESFDPESARHYLRERWHTPEELLGRTLAEYSIVSRLLNQRNDKVADGILATANSLAIIVHGTWAAKELWWRPNLGSLWKHVKAKWPHLYGGGAPYAWSGKNNHAARVAGAQQLVQWAHSVSPISLDIIAHSHGGNVCLLAARMGVRINRLILLGTPIRTEYMLDLKNIATIANVFSLADSLQTPLGTAPHRRFEGRTLGDSANVSNWRAERDGHGGQPGHSDLHEPATWVASGLDTLLA